MKYLLEQRITTPLQQKWLTKLMELSYKIHYRKGKENVVADALSRRGDQGLECTVITTIVPEWIKEVISSYQGDDWAQNSIKEVLLKLDQIPNLSYQNGALKFKGRVVVGSRGEIRKRLISTLHDSQSEGHSGIQASFMRAKQLFY